MRIFLKSTALLFLLSPSRSSAFVAPPAKLGISTSSSSITGSALGAVPVLEKWKIGQNGAVIGVVKNHPTIPDGDRITTSPLKGDLSTLQDNQFVVTKSGSKYKLGKGLGSPRKVAAQKPTVIPPKPVPAAKKTPVKKAASPAKPVQKIQPKPSPAPKAVAPKPAPTPKPAPPAPKPMDKKSNVQALLQKAKTEYNLNGKSIADGKYVLVGKQIRSSSTRSQIYYAYRADTDGLPTGPRLTVKISPTLERLERESRNYNSITGGLFGGQFVKKIEFLPKAGGDKSLPQLASALVLQSGERNLRTLFDARNFKGLEGTAMRQAAVAIAQCIQAIHSSGLVWTDLKAENFVVISTSLGDGSIEGVKGIDLESAVPVKGPPIDYSPEACPPEFARAEAAGRGAEFQLEYNYDIWSFGVLLYELSVGTPIFGKKRDGQITKLLRDRTFEPDVSAVPDDRLRDLIKQCLDLNPQKRPGITQVLLHPYFLTTGIGPFSF